MTVLKPILDLIFPDRCVNCGRVGEYFCSNCLGLIRSIEVQICPYCKRASIGGKTHPICRKKYGLDGLASGFYYQGPIKKAAHLLKYQLITNLQTDLTKKLVESLQNQNVKFKDFVLVPIPLYPSRERKRGFNQAKILGQPLAEDWNLKLNDKLLRRVKNTKPQVNLTEKERQENLKGAFELVDEPEEKILLVDDVFTTGATMMNAAAVLKRGEAQEVWALTLARAQSY